LPDVSLEVPVEHEIGEEAVKTTVEVSFNVSEESLCKYRTDEQE